MKRLGTFIVALLLTSALAPVLAVAQTPVTSIGPITAGNCVAFNSNNIIRDAGFLCTGQGILPNASTPGTILYYNGTAWVIFAGNSSGTNCLGENAVGAPQWTTCSGGSGANPGGTNGQIQYNASSTFGGFTMSGDMAVNTSTGVATIQPAAVTNSKLATGAANTIKGTINGSSTADLTPTSLWDSFCSTTVGNIWVRLSSAWGCTSVGYSNPVWWGADPTGSADSTSAFNSALSVALAAGGQVNIPCGTYKITSSLPAQTTHRIPVFFVIVGEGSGTTVINFVRMGRAECISR